ncbi:unnamed protein product [Gordionus sp. m RMFG-2023]
MESLCSLYRGSPALYLISPPENENSSSPLKCHTPILQSGLSSSEEFNTPEPALRHNRFPSESLNQPSSSRAHQTHNAINNYANHHRTKRANRMTETNPGKSDNRIGLDYNYSSNLAKSLLPNATNFDHQPIPAPLDWDAIIASRLGKKKNPISPNDDIIKRPEVLYHLISIEDKYLSSPSYFTCLQTEIEPYMRKTLVTWMYEVCEELKRRKDVFQLAVNYLDRFLSSINTPKCHLQLLGSACMLLASKFKEALPLSSQILIVYTDHSITLPELLKWELLLSSVLNWDIAAPTSSLILELLVQLHPHFYNMNPDLKENIQKTTQFFLDKCSLEFLYSSFPPSMMASSCLCIAYIMYSYEYYPTFQDNSLFAFLDNLTLLTNIETDILKNLIPVVGDYLEGFYDSKNNLKVPNSNTNNDDKNNSHFHGRNNDTNINNTLPPESPPIRPESQDDNQLVAIKFNAEGHRYSVIENGHDYCTNTFADSQHPEIFYDTNKMDSSETRDHNSYIKTDDGHIRKLEDIYPTPPPIEKFDNY